MKKKIGLAVFIFIIFTLLIALNMEVTYRQGVNYVVYTRKVPLYLKLLDFFDRHFNYQRLVRQIVPSSVSQDNKALILLSWTKDNLHKQPQELPVIDDHVWHIIIRGYGASDQFADVFSTLCNYSGMESFFLFITSSGDRIPFSFTKVKDRWCVFDPYNGIYFKNHKGELACVEDLNKGDWVVVRFAATVNKEYDYKIAFTGLPKDVNGDVCLRSGIQSPLQRLKYVVTRRFNLKR